MDPVIFLEKVRRPVLRGLVRDRLARRAASLVGPGADGPSISLVLGPPGSGKTTLLSHLADTSSAAVAWYRVGTEDDDEVALTRHLGYALGAATGTPSLVEAAAPGRIADLVRALEDPASRPVHLVVDDLHEIAGSPAEQALETFLSLRPRTLAVTLGSRRPPRINTSRLLVSGELVQLDGEDLRFRSWEVEQLFRTVYASPLSPEAAAALTRRTGGWAAGLQLFQLATAQLSRAERERAVGELGGRSRLIRSYLARNVLEGLAPARRRFLLVTSTLGVLTGDLCDQLLDTSGSAAVLAELEREQFFTTSTDDGLTFHYHQVLQTHLEVLLVDELGSRAARGLYSRSAELLEQAGRTAAAVRAHARAEDWGSVARLLKPDTAPVGGDEALLWGVLSLPGAPTDDPGLVLAGARRLARAGRVGDAVAAFRQAEALLDDPEFRRRCARERAATAVWLPAGPAAGPTVDGHDPESAALRRSLALRALTRAIRPPKPDDERLVRALNRLLAGDLPGVRRELARADSTSAPSSAWVPLSSVLVERVAEWWQSSDAAAAGRMEEVMLAADVEGWPWLSRLARGVQGVVLFADAPRDWSGPATAELLEELAQGGDRWSFCLTALALGVVTARCGDRELAVRTLSEARRVATELDAPVLAVWAEVLLAAVDPTPPAARHDARLAAALRHASGLGLVGAADAALGLRRRAVVPVVASAVTGPLLPALPPVAPNPPAVELCCLGAFALRRGDVEVPWRSLRPRVRALLMLLALHHGRLLHREQLVDTLWPDATLASGVRSLQVAVSSIRQCLVAGGLSEDALRRHGDAYGLLLPEAYDQLAAFEERARDAARVRGAEALRLRLSALACYPGDLLPEVGPAEWVVEARDRLRLLAASVAVAAAQDAVAADDLPTALEAARRSVDLDPYHDPAWRLVVELHEGLGDRAAAAVARREQTRVWADLGLAVPAAGLPAGPAGLSGASTTAWSTTAP